MSAWLFNSKCGGALPFDKITVHASATPPNQNHDVESIRAMHLKKKWSDIGYHVVIKRDGEIQVGRPWAIKGAHTYGFNTNNFGICMIGGVDSQMKAEDNFTPEQYDSLREVLIELVARFGVKEEHIKGHRDYSPDLNADGVISPNEFIKQCPCFDVKDLLESWK